MREIEEFPTRIGKLRDLAAHEGLGMLSYILTLAKKEAEEAVRRHVPLDPVDCRPLDSRAGQSGITTMIVPRT